MKIGKTFRVINEKVRNRLVTASEAGRGIKDHPRAVPEDFRKNDAPGHHRRMARRTGSTYYFQFSAKLQ